MTSQEGAINNESENGLISGLRERANSVSEKVKQRVIEKIIPSVIRKGDEAEVWLSEMQSDFGSLVEDPNDPSGGGVYKDWTPEEIRELYKVLYNEEMEEM